MTLNTDHTSIDFEREGNRNLVYCKYQLILLSNKTFWVQECVPFTHLKIFDKRPYLDFFFFFTYLKPKKFHKGIDEVLKAIPKKYIAWHWEYELFPARDDKTTGL